MDPLRIELNSTGRKQSHWSRILQGSGAIVLLVIAILRQHDDWLWIVVGINSIAILIAAFGIPAFTRPRQLVVDDKGIRGNISWRGRFDCPWSNLKSARLELFALDLETNDGRNHHIDLGNLTYQEHQELKPRLREILTHHGLVRD